MSFFSNEGAISSAVAEINSRDANYTWSYSIVSDSQLDLSWSYLDTPFSIEMFDDDMLVVRNECGDTINDYLDYDDDVFDTIVSVFDYASRCY